MVAGRKWRRSSGVAFGVLACAVFAGATSTLAGPPVFASGVVTDGGAAVAGADVLVLILPSAAAGAGAPVGGQSSSLVAGRVHTDGAGGFVVRLDPRRVPASLLDSAGDARVLVVAADSTRQLTWMFTAVRTGTGWSSTAGPPSGQPAAASLRFDLGARAFAGLSQDPSAAWLDPRTGQAMGANSPNGTVQVQPRSAPLFAMTADTPAPGGCGTVYWGTTYNARTEFYRPDWSWSGADWTVSQEIDESQNLGVGFDFGGTWRQSGTAGLLNSSGAGGSVANAADNWILNAVDYRDETVQCVPGVYRVPVSMWALFTGFAYAGHPTYPPANCTHEQSGTFYRTTGTASTYGAAIGLGSISVSAQSGYSTTSNISWTVTSPTWMCGNTSGWSRAGSVETHQG